MARVRAKAGERLDDTTVKGVIDSLNGNDPITKKEACEILNISYNTTRLNKIISEYEEKIAWRTKRKRELRKAPITIKDKKEIIESYLAGDALSAISDSTYRSIAVIKRVLTSFNVPIRNTGVTYQNPPLIPDNGINNNYEKGDLVFSARYNCPAYIRHKIDDETYALWTTGDYTKNVYQPYWELGDMRPIQKDLEIEIKGMDHEEYKRLIYEAWLKSKKRDKK